MRPTPDEAAAIVEAAAPRLPGEEVATAAAVGRVLARGYRARWDLPPGHRAAVDGYYLDPTTAVAGEPLLVVGEAAAGQGPVPLPPAGRAVRVATGTALADPGAVVRQEDVRREGERVVLSAAVPRWANVRRQGEEAKAGEELAQEGTPVSPWLAALLAAAGHPRLLVRARPTLVAVICGDELRSAEALDASGTVETHSLVLAAWAAHRAFRHVTTTVIGDDADALAQRLRVPADLLVSTGGAGPGSRDPVPEAAARLGATPLFSGIAMRPGGPTRAYLVLGRVWLALPGNPMAVALALDLLAEAWWRGATGAPAPRRRRARAGVHLRGRSVAWYVRGRILGELFFPHPLQGAGGLRPLAEGDVWAVVPPGGVVAGEALDVLPSAFTV